ncbi:hypothetical protein TBLA_0B04940 [Henningerozyma blattae CBS 6284]|uniref:Dolichol-phosphate mannosyltransferase subunit 1 n=1 Tax=Henningerozyma blattae (strain ATCC 34711 / CBS 6284 / DSM 70876 / NBRC 10599 / NRRL Y-10934 / UCD 77-7) TaxID=1071380 RepID=I2GYX7_HENB6|nr:hypothetical protein TBLA_0B04940 [Tetrapisispora blattae CBS 6284]CCH59329.1 hypothetical protein TBLA_0B04940 [Tetrapisispora blattae CBS 6284]
MLSQNILNSIIVPTYDEKSNIKTLTTNLFPSLATEESNLTELIFVDNNSNDGSIQQVEELNRQGYNVRIIIRRKNHGLSSSVLRGFQAAQGDILICMDANLQHTPESVPQLIESLRIHPFTIGTRYVTNVGIEQDWPLYRRVISKGSSLLAKPLTTTSDPMIGFFGLPRKYLIQLKAGAINPQCFKISLELMVKLRLPKRCTVGEILYSLGITSEGQSKLPGKVILQYVLQLKDLYQYRYGSVEFTFITSLITIFYTVAFYQAYCVVFKFNLDRKLLQ